MTRISRAALLLMTVVTSMGVSAQQTIADASPADACPAPLTAKPGPAIRLLPRARPHLSRPGIAANIAANDTEIVTQPGPIPFGPPLELKLTHAGSSKIDLRTLPQTPPVKKERPERTEPAVNPTAIQNTVAPPTGAAPTPPSPSAPAPGTIANFDGLDYANWGAGHPPDTNGDAGPTYYIQTINTSIGVFRKSDGFRVAGFKFDTFMSQGHFGNLCDTDNFGDPVVLYDSFEDRWIITDFAFQLDGSGNVINPPGSFQCIAASMTGDPVSGGWNYYSINTAGGMGDYPKFGIWPDGLYMSANMFEYASNGSYLNPRVYAFNKAQMYAGKPSVQVVTFDAPSAEFTLLPANARLQDGTPPAGSPNYYSVVWQYTNAVSVYKFHVNWSAISASSFTGPFLSIAPTNWNSPPDTVPSQGGTPLDTLALRLMAQNQYTNESGTESLWLSHTVKGAAAATAAPRFYQVPVTGGAVAANTTQAFTYTPDTTMMRFTPSVAVDRGGDMAIGYSTSSSTSLPAIKYAGRLATDALNSLPQTETVLKQGAGTQDAPFNRWGDYSAMTLDPDGCTFWYTNLYYATTGSNFLTRIGSFAFPACTPFGAGGTLHGTVTAAAGGAPLVGATVALGTRTTTTNGSGFYSFSIPAGTYPSVSVSQPGYVSQTATNIVITDANTTTNDFALVAAAASGCLTDTTQSDFQSGIPASVDLVGSPGNVILLNPANLDQQNVTITTNGFSFNSVSWVGQTFTPSVTGKLTRADIDLFCSSCTGSTPNITVSIRATAGSPLVPTGADLATATIAGFNNASDGYFTALFATPPTLTSGTRYAVILRAVSDASPGTYAYTCSCNGSNAGPNSSPYASGQIVTSVNSGGTWTADTTTGGRDLGFKTYMQTVFNPSGNLVSGLKDSNPTAGLTPVWSALSWTATTPANTSIQFQVAGSNSDSGPFNFVGPDGTSATFFTTSGASLTQFYGLRYLEYKAYLATTNNTVTPTLNDVSICFADNNCSAPPSISPSPAQVCPNSTGNTAAGPAGATSYAWSISNGTITSVTDAQSITYTAGASGTAGLTLAIVVANGCHESGSVNVPILSTVAPTIFPGGPTTFCAGGSVTLTSNSPGGNQWYLNGNPIAGALSQSIIASASGDYTVTACSGSASTATTVTVNPVPPTPTITPGGPTTFCAPGSVTLTSSSPSGNQWSANGTPIGGATSQAYIATASGDYTVVVTTNGCGSFPSAATTVIVNASATAPTITPGGPTTFCAGGSVTLTSSSAGGNQWYLNGNPINGATNQAYLATAAGDYTVIVTASGCSNAPSAATTVTLTPLPPTPTITPGGPTTFCAGGSVTLTSSSASGNQWLLNGNPIGGATNQTYPATASGNYSVTVTSGGCTSAPSVATAVTVTPIPATPAVTPGGPTTFCTGGSVTLTSSSATGNQWYLGGNPIGGATNQAYIAAAAGDYTVTVTTSGCISSPSSATTVTVNPIPAAPTISGGPATFCAGGSVTLTSSSTAGNQWFSNGNLIGGATSRMFLATVAGDYSVTVTTGGCTSAPSSATTVTVNPLPNAAITSPSSMVTGTSSGASVANAGAGATYVWGITNGTITAGAGTSGITFTAGAIGTATLNVTVTTAAGCSDAKTANITVKSAAPDPTIASVVPAACRIAGGAPLTINGTGFQSGATVTIGGNAATHVVFVSSVKLTATAPTHAAGLVGVKVTNPDTTTTTSNNAFTYLAQQFDANGDSQIDPSDIFYMVAYLFTHGPAPRGAAGMLSGDANGDGVVDPADIFYTVNFLFTHGPQPFWTPAPPRVTTSYAQSFRGALSLGDAATREGRTYVPVILTMDPKSPVPQAIALKLLFEAAPRDARIHRSGAAANATTSFEISRQSDNELSYLVAFDQKAGGLSLGDSHSAIIAEVELAATESLSIDFDPDVTLLTDASATHSAKLANGTLQISGITGRKARPRRLGDN